MPDSVPEMPMPVTETILPVPTFRSAKDPVDPVVPSVTVSPEITPTRAAEVVFREAERVPSYVLLAAVTPDTVNVFAVIDAVAVGWVSE